MNPALSFINARHLSWISLLKLVFNFFVFKTMSAQMVKKNSPFSHMGNSDKVLDSLKSSSAQWGLGGEE